MADATRVALLARPGEACERLRAALREAGGDIVLEGDPSTLSAEMLSAAAPQTVLVALDPAVEDALDRFDAVLGDPNVAVIFDEADLAARREGWDAARWVRHLSAKLHRHDDVLPPGREPDADDVLVPGTGTGSTHRVPAPADLQEMAASGTPAFETAASNAESFDADPMIEGLPGLGLEAVPESALEFDAAVSASELDLPATDAVSSFSGIAFTDDITEMTLEGDAPAADFDFGGDAGFDALLAGLEPAAEAAPERPLVETGLDEFLASAPEVALDAVAELPGIDTAPVATPAAVPEPARPAFDFSDLSLADLEGAASAPQAAAPTGRFQHDIADLERRIASMGLADGPDGAPAAPAAAPVAAPTTALAAPAPTPPASAPPMPSRGAGAVLILAGIGGPDAVRQILSALPASFPRPVLISQRLDGGRYDRLVQQMGRAAALPVQLAQAGSRADAGQVYIVPPEVGLETGDGLQFLADAPLLAALPADDSAVLFLSGADPAQVDGALAKAAEGALVAGQSPEGCYDAAAPVALTTRGGAAGNPIELVQRLLQRWPA